MKNFLFIAILCFFIACNEEDLKELPEAGFRAGIEAGSEAESQAGISAALEAGIEGGNEMSLAGMMFEQKAFKLRVDIDPIPFK